MSNLTRAVDSLTLHRLLRQSSIAKAVICAKMLFVLLVLILVVFLGSAAIEEYLALGTTLEDLNNRVASISVKDRGAKNAAAGDSNYSAIHKKSIFGDIKPKAAPAPKVEEKKKTALSLALIGTFISSDDSEAIIEDTKKKSQEVFALNEEIFDTGAQLIAVFSSKVEIKRDGEIEILTIDDGLGASGGGDVGGDADEDIVVDEQELNQALDNLPLLLTQARAVPYFKDGKAVGLRLFAIKNGSLYEKVGLKNGDILKSINGASLGDISQAMKLFEKLKEERQISLELERNRQKKVYKYRIQ